MKGTSQRQLQKANPKGKRLDIKTLKQLYDEDAPAVLFDEKTEKNFKDLVETAVVQAKAIEEWGFRPAEVILGDD